VACHELGFDFMGFEIDKQYFDLAQERLAAVTAQTRMEFER
jgi:site-specific DNA-methyltransferase (adenine-specific)